MIRDGFDAGLDELRNAKRGGKDWIAKLQADEIARTGIASLKVRFNSVFGYYIEVTKSNLDKVPPQYIRKQTIANGERFITPELKDMEGKILGAEERSVKLEYELFQRVREEVLGQLPKIQQTAAALAQLDVLGSFAETARLQNYCRPQIGDGGVVQIRDGRHPVLEQQLVEERFVPNDTGFKVGQASRLPSPRFSASRWKVSRPPLSAGAGGTPALLLPKSPSSPARTWRANAPTSGRWRCSCCSRTPAVSSRLPARALTSWTASSPASARATTWRAGNPLSWWK